MNITHDNETPKNAKRFRKEYTENEMDDAYDKGFMDGAERALSRAYSLTGNKIIKVLLEERIKINDELSRKSKK